MRKWTSDDYFVKDQSRNGGRILRLKKIVLSNGKELPDL